MKTLIITNKEDITSDFIVNELSKRNSQFYRFNTEELYHSCYLTLDFSKNRFILFDQFQQKEIDLNSVTSVYYRRPQLPIFDNADINKQEYNFLQNEAFYTLEGIYKIVANAFWLNPIYSIREAENKIYQLKIAQSIGFKIPDSIITNDFSEVLNFYDKIKGNCIIKPIKSGLIGTESDSKIIFTSQLHTRPTSKERIEVSANYLQREIKKEFDVRVIVVGKKVFATLIHSQGNKETQTDWRKGEKVLIHTTTTLPTEISNKCIQLLDILGLNFGAIDLVLNKDGEYIFLEINPNGQWAWIEKRTKHPISLEIVNILTDEKKIKRN